MSKHIVIKKVICFFLQFKKKITVKKCLPYSKSFIQKYGIYHSSRVFIILEHECTNGTHGSYYDSDYEEYTGMYEQNSDYEDCGGMYAHNSDNEDRGRMFVMRHRANSKSASTSTSALNQEDVVVKIFVHRRKTE